MGTMGTRCNHCIVIHEIKMAILRTVCCQVLMIQVYTRINDTDNDILGANSIILPYLHHININSWI